MSKMIERVARALAERRVYEGYNAETRARLIEQAMYGARSDALIAINAMREPTEHMEHQGWHEITQLDGHGPTEAGLAWRAMIDAALADAREHSSPRQVVQPIRDEPLLSKGGGESSSRANSGGTASPKSDSQEGH